MRNVNSISDSIEWNRRLGIELLLQHIGIQFFLPSLSLSPFRLFSYLLGEFVFIYIPPGDVLRIAGRGRDVCVRVSRYALNYCPLTNMGARDRKSNRSRSKIDYEMMEEDGTRVRITTVNVANNQNSD